MKVLLVNKFYRPAGGAERYVALWSRLLRERGHQVIPFAMRDRRNWPTPYSAYFVHRVDFDRPASARARLRAAGRAVYSLEAAQRISALVRRTRPDVAHVHSYCYQLTGSVLAALRRAHVPVVQTAHEYKHACPNQRLYNQRTNRLCEACAGGRWWAPLFQRCIKGSLAASGVGCVEQVADRLTGLSRRGIGHVIAPSDFLRRTLIAFGWPGRQISHVPNFVPLDDYDPSHPCDPYLLFLGRLVRHKGIRTLLDDASGGRIAAAGFVTGRLLQRLIERCLAVVVPSEWYENCPYAVLEAMAAGRAVVGARIGGIPELVQDGRTGLLFAPGDRDALLECLRRLWEDRRGAASMGREGRRIAEARYGPEDHYRAVLQRFRGVR